VGQGTPEREPDGERARVSDLDLSALDAGTAVSRGSIAEADRRIRKAPKKWAAWSGKAEALARVLAFARDNGLEFSPESTARDFHGLIWDEGTTYRLEHLWPAEIKGARPDGPDYGTVGRADRNGAIHSTGTSYLAIRLDRKLPHIVLQRRRGVTFYAGEVPELELEGDFGEHFELHVPKGYERDALYVLTPDVMQVLIDEAADQRVEIVDDRLFVFGERFDVMDPEVHARMHRVTAAIAAQVQPQADGYRDERVRRDPQAPLAVDRVAPAGRRLPPRVWVPGVLLVIALAVSVLWGILK
jgi:hypothetical protein